MAGFGTHALRSYVVSGALVAALGGGIAWLIVTGKHSDPASMGEPMAGDPSDAVADMPYQGEMVPLARAYRDYEDYEDDPHRLPVASMAQVERLLRAGRIEPTYASREAMAVAVVQLQFPGFGALQMGDAPQPDGSILSGQAIEIPSVAGDKLRYFVFRGQGGTWRLIDDFVAEGKDIARVTQEEAELVYQDLKAQPVLRRTPAAP